MTSHQMQMLRPQQTWRHLKVASAVHTDHETGAERKWCLQVNFYLGDFTEHKLFLEFYNCRHWEAPVKMDQRKKGQLSLQLRGHRTGHVGLHNRPLGPGACIPQMPWPPRMGVHPVVFWTPRWRDVRTWVVTLTATCDNDRHLLQGGKTVPKMKLGVWATAVNPSPRSVCTTTHNHVLSFHVTIQLHATFTS